MRRWFGWMLLLVPLCASAANLEEYAVAVNGVERWTGVIVPARYRPGAPVVVLLHGGTQSMRKILGPRGGGVQAWPLLAEREGFLLLIPNATHAETGDPKGDHQNWNDLRPAGVVGQSDADDVGFLIALLDWAQHKYRYDPGRVYLTGASNGGMMTLRMLIERPERIAAAAVFIAALPAQGAPRPPPGPRVPLMLANGTQDPLIQWQGGTVRGGRGATMAIEPMVQWWREVNGVANATPVHETLPDRDPKDGCRIVRELWPASGPNSAPLLFYRIDGGGHSLPTVAYPPRDGPIVRRIIGPVCRDAEGAELAWEFLQQHRRTLP